MIFVDFALYRLCAHSLFKKFGKEDIIMISRALGDA